MSDFALNARKASFWFGGTRLASAAQSMADLATRFDDILHSSSQNDFYHQPLCTPK